MAPTAARSLDKLLPLAASPGEYALWRYRNVAINHWLRDVSLAGVAKLSALTAERQHELPEGVTSIHWLNAGVSLPSAEVRSALSDIMVRYPDHVMSVGVVVETEGFFASALRSAVTGIVLLSPKTIPVRVFGKLDDLVQWLPEVHQRATGVAVTSDELAGVLREAIARSGR